MPSASYRILDLGVTVTSSSEPFLDLVDTDYACFRVTGVPEGRPFAVTFEPGPPALLSLDGRGVEVAGHAFPAEYALFGFHRALMEAVADFTVLHAAVLGAEGGAVAVCGGSGTGKTTLTLDLLAAGLGFLSDDFCPVHRETRLVHPFPRSLWVRETPAAPGSRAPTLHGGKSRRVARDGACRVEDRPLPLRWLVCLERGEAGTDTDLLQVGIREQGREALLAELAAVPGVTLEPPRFEGSHEWQVRHPRDAQTVRALAALLERHAPAVWNSSLVPGGIPDFDRIPCLTPIASHEAAFILLRERKQPSVTGALRPGAFLAHLTGLLEGVACYRLTPGHREDRCNLVLQLLEDPR